MCFYHIEILRNNFDAYGIASQTVCNDIRCSRTHEGIENGIGDFGKQFNKPFRQSFRKCRTVIFVAALGCQMQDIGRIGFISAEPVRDVFPETAADFGLVS